MNQRCKDAEGVAPSQTGEAGAPGISRRALLKAGLAGGLVAATGGGCASFSEALEKAKSEYVLILDLNKCAGCRACEEACNQRNHLPEDQSYIRILSRGDEENRWYLPVQCQHCQDTPCATVCPVDATYHHPSGVVLVNEKTCVGCKYCIVACPYGARIFDEHKGVASKCWLCLDWVLGGGEPACVQACLKEARIFGKRSDPLIAKLLASGRAQPLHPEFGTDPGVLMYIFPGT
ncbi:MAG: 4Fe-4S dicluster domain-containing protein [Anaerolineae bacterium]|jgi:Fe-S-cluster-containing dehydrogenase component